MTIVANLRLETCWVRWRKGLGASQACLGRVLAALGPLFGSFWALLGVSWAPLGGRLGRLLGGLGRQVGAKLAFSTVQQGPNNGFKYVSLFQHRLEPHLGTIFMDLVPTERCVRLEDADMHLTLGCLGSNIGARTN